MAVPSVLWCGMTDPSLVASFSVSPRYAQVSVSDSGATDYPQWEMGDERAVSLADCVAISTREDRFGPVDIEVYLADDADYKFSSYHRVYSDQVEVPSGVMLVGSVTGTEEQAFQLSERRAKVSVWVDSPNAPAALKIVIVQVGRITCIPTP